MAAVPPAVRILDQLRIPYELVRFDASIRDAERVAAESGRPPEMVYKTIVVETDPPGRKPYVVMLPSQATIDLRVLAASVEVKKLRIASHADAERLTGLKVGGISAIPLARRGGFQCLVEQDALELDQIIVSAGERGADVQLATTDLMKVTNAIAVRAYERA